MTLAVNPTLFAQDYRALLEPALQQKGSRLRPYVINDTATGVKQKVAVNRIEQVQTGLVTGQAQPKTATNAAVARRWVVPISRDLSQIFDHFDMLKIAQDMPTSAALTNAINAHGRDFDDEILDAMFRPTVTGETGGATTAFDTTNNQIALNFNAAGNTRVTVAKLREAKRILLSWENDFDNDPAYCVITSKEHDSLLAEAQVISRDYNDTLVLKDGKVTEYMGFKFILCERLQLDPTATWRRVPVFMKSGVNFTGWEDVVTDVDQRKDLKGNPWEVYSMATFGAARTDEKRIVEIKSAP